MPLVLSITNEQKIRITAAPVTTSGAPAALDGSINVTVVSGEATAEPDPTDPNSAYLVSGTNPGDSTFLVEGDADLGAGIVLIQDTVTLTVTGALAASLGLVAGAAEPK